MSVLASPAPGGAENLVCNLGTEFVAHGHAHHVLFLSDLEGVGGPVEFQAGLLAAIEAGGSSYEIMVKGSFRSPGKAARELRRAIASFRPDVLHLHLGRALLCRFLSGVRVPTVYTHHSVVANFPPLLLRLLALSVDHYIAISRATRAFLEKHVRGPISDIPNGVPESFVRRLSRPRPAADPFILSVGSLRAVKDYPTLVQAAATVVPVLTAQGRKPRFAIAGEGSERPKLERLIEETGLTGSFELLGVRSDVPELVRKADLMVNSSLHEGLPITLIEGATSALPIVATNVGGNPDIVLHGRTGILVPPSSAEALSDGIESLLCDEALYAACSAAAKLHAGRFSMTQCAEDHLALYNSLL